MSYNGSRFLSFQLEDGAVGGLRSSYDFAFPRVKGKEEPGKILEGNQKKKREVKGGRSLLKGKWQDRTTGTGWASNADA